MGPDKSITGLSLAKNPIFSPPGGDLGDTFPFYHENQYHLFALQPPHVAHFVSNDFVTWEIRPVAIPIGAPGEPDDGPMIATGTVIHEDRTFYMFYTAGAAQTICLATSSDLDHWEKHSSNPVLAADDKHYASGHFRDPYVFFNREERCWWMLIGASVPDRPGPRAGCVGLAKSTDLLDWQLQDPLWAPGIGPHCDCPQLVEHAGRWYLFYLHRNTRYRVASSATGEFERASVRDIGTRFAAAGSRPFFDGHRWITFPFVNRLDNEIDLGPTRYGGPLAVPRVLRFFSDGVVGEKPLEEIVAALERIPPLPLSAARPIRGDWETSGDLVCNSDDGGAAVLTDAPGNVYVDVDVLLPKREMEVRIALREASDPRMERQKAEAGYMLVLRPDEGSVSVRRNRVGDRVLVARNTSLPVGTPFKIQIFLSDSVLEVFVDNRVSLTCRVYEKREGAIYFEFIDSRGEFRNLKIRELESSDSP